MLVEYRLTKTLPVDDVRELYSCAGWITPETPTDFIQPMLEQSALIAGAFAGQKLVGMARALSDLSSDACIHDVVVLPQYRKQGIGGKLVKMLVAELQKSGVDWIDLISVPGQENFYRECGFEVLPKHTPMKFAAD